MKVKTAESRKAMKGYFLLADVSVALGVTHVKALGELEALLDVCPVLANEVEPITAHPSRGGHWESTYLMTAAALFAFLGFVGIRDRTKLVNDVFSRPRVFEMGCELAAQEMDQKNNRNGGRMMRAENRRNAATNRRKQLKSLNVSTSSGALLGAKKLSIKRSCSMPKRFSNAGMKHSAAACILSTNGGIIPASLHVKGRGLGGLLKRRIIAASRFCRGVFLFGLDSYAVHSLTSAPHGKPKGLQFPFELSANPCGVAHPLGGGVGGNQNRSNGEC